jgi:competence protein ComGC
LQFQSKLIELRKMKRTCINDTQTAGFAMVELLIIFVVVVLLAVMTVPIFKKMNEASSQDMKAPAEPALIEEAGMPPSQ